MDESMAGESRTDPFPAKKALPSVRLIFEDTRAQQSFLHYLRQVNDGRVSNPSVAMMLEKLAKPIQVQDVPCEE